jgi:hypothetical protein
MELNEALMGCASTATVASEPVAPVKVYVAICACAAVPNKPRNDSRANLCNRQGYNFFIQVKKKMNSREKRQVK